jgi:hypothetical protein
MGTLSVFEHCAGDTLLIGSLLLEPSDYGRTVKAEKY